eukprot:TRINITY_DN2824_c0_g1_i3.p1 TRINITY_DN2824_c0_g1~~TRINITY_DN2824_c0_g1_i3.p1  ORF type:complete len:418 (-),score=75.24 TRINITY_DN2824_c0_g1_i3:152-1405(-)
MLAVDSLFFCFRITLSGRLVCGSHLDIAEGLNKLKDLSYLNLAMNNITKIENLECCEALTKLDLTLNFVKVVDLLSLEKLQRNTMLAELFLTGNPCRDYRFYREFVVGTLPQLQILDGDEITRAERLAATQLLVRIRLELEMVQKGEIDLNAVQKPKEGAAAPDPESLPPVVEYAADGGGEMTQHTPEERTRMYRELAQQKAEQEELRNPKPKPRKTNAELAAEESLTRDGQIMQRNEGKWEFLWDETPAGDCITLDVDVGKYLDTSLLDVDVHPTHIRVLIKGKLLQLVLPTEVVADKANAKRSQLTGHLLITMPKLHPTERTWLTKSKIATEHSESKPKLPAAAGLPTSTSATTAKSTALTDDAFSNPLLVGPARKSAPHAKTVDGGGLVIGRARPQEVFPAAGFVDDADVPPLI